MKKIIFLLSILVPIEAALAETTYSGKKIGGPSSEWTASDSSEVNRQAPKWGIFGALGGKSSIGLDYSINPDNVVEIAYSHNWISDYNITDRIADSKDLGLIYRHYLGSTFVVGGGLIHRRDSLEGEQWYGYEDNSASQYSHILDYERGREVVVARFVIGNQWQWKHFFVGIDWLVLDQLLGQTKTSYKSSPYAIPQTDGQRATLERAESSARHENFGFSKRLQSYDPMFRIGWAF